MSATETSSHSQPASLPASSRELHEDDNAHYRAILRDLIDRGADLARQLHERAAKEPESDLTIPFDRIARTIRRTIALARHIATNPPKARTAPERGPADRAPAGLGTVDRTQAREKIIRGVEDAIEARRGPKTDTEMLYTELNERLLDDGLERDLRTRPIDDIIEELARDLGVAHQSRAYVWKRRTPADIASLRARAAKETPYEPENLSTMVFSQFQPQKRWSKPP